MLSTYDVRCFGQRRNKSRIKLGILVDETQHILRYELWELLACLNSVQSLNAKGRSILLMPVWFWRQQRALLAEERRTRPKLRRIESLSSVLAHLRIAILGNCYITAKFQSLSHQLDYLCVLSELVFLSFVAAPSLVCLNIL